MKPLTRWCMSCARYKPPGGPQKQRVWKCADCRKAIAEHRAKVKTQEQA